MEFGNICIVEDDSDTRGLLSEFLESKNYKIFQFGSVEHALAELTIEDFRGIYLLDCTLPGISGFEFIKMIRKIDKISKIFVISAMFGKEHVLEGLRAGADDYLTKPFSIEELEVRIFNAQRRLEVIKTDVEAGLKLLPEFSSVVRDGVTVHLTKREFTIFEKLRYNYQLPTTRDELITCFENDEKVNTRNIDVHVVSLRKKIKPIDFSIDTVWGKGYQLN